MLEKGERRGRHSNYSLHGELRKGRIKILQKVEN
jgi:hypothetical protein